MSLCRCVGSFAGLSVQRPPATLCEGANALDGRELAGGAADCSLRSRRRQHVRYLTGPAPVVRAVHSGGAAEWRRGMEHCRADIHVHGAGDRVRRIFRPSLEVMTDRLGLGPGVLYDADGGKRLDAELFTPLWARSRVKRRLRHDRGFGRLRHALRHRLLRHLRQGDLHLTWWPLFRDCVYYCMLPCWRSSSASRRARRSLAGADPAHVRDICVIMKFNENLRNCSSARAEEEEDDTSAVAEVGRPPASGGSWRRRARRTWSAPAARTSRRARRATSDAQASAVSWATAASSHGRAEQQLPLVEVADQLGRCRCASACWPSTSRPSVVGAFKLKSKKAGVPRSSIRSRTAPASSSRPGRAARGLWERPVR